MTYTRAARAIRYAPFALAAFVLTGCGVFNTGAAKEQGKGAAGNAADKAKGVGSSAQNFALTKPHLAASLLVAVFGAIALKFLWKSAQIKYVVFIALGLFAGYAIFGPR